MQRLDDKCTAPVNSRFLPLDMVRNWMVICITKIRTINIGMCNWILLHYPSNNVLYDVIWLLPIYKLAVAAITNIFEHLLAI